MYLCTLFLPNDHPSAHLIKWMLKCPSVLFLLSHSLWLLSLEKSNLFFILIPFLFLSILRKGFYSTIYFFDSDSTFQPPQEFEKSYKSQHLLQAHFKLELWGNARDSVAKYYTNWSLNFEFYWKKIHQERKVQKTCCFRSHTEYSQFILLVK